MVPERVISSFGCVVASRLLDGPPPYTRVWGLLAALNCQTFQAIDLFCSCFHADSSVIFSHYFIIVTFFSLYIFISDLKDSRHGCWFKTSGSSGSGDSSVSSSVLARWVFHQHSLQLVLESGLHSANLNKPITEYITEVYNCCI